jgi:hypothetical protein
MNARKNEDPGSHLAPIDVRRRIVRVIVRSAREEAGLAPRPVRDPRVALARRLRAWRRRALPLF